VLRYLIVAVGGTLFANRERLIMEKLIEYVIAALGTMAATGPRRLRAYLAQPGPDFDKASPTQVDRMIGLLMSPDPNHPARLRFSDLLRTWDNTKDASWTDGTPRNTEARRARIHQLLQSEPELQQRIDTAFPFYPLEEPLIISEKHKEWYVPTAGRDYYWNTYKRYLKEYRAWRDESLLSLDNTTRAIIECLANPEGREAYASRGLVMGYVQSGKTANFAGVAARAADAGYRLIIILAGTWNILRNQTQRRLDKELLGKELLHNDEFYLQQLPADWGEFLEHGFDPVERGYPAWQRLTRPEIDFKRLKAAIETLEFERRNKALPIYHPENLHVLPVKLLVVKKNSVILKNLVKDLGLLRTGLKDLPTLIIDDESDQAGINTRDPQKAKPGEERTATNLAIVNLLRLLPRGQYVGYTATPYANALVNPDDTEDLFPKDFIISLDRPIGYMGVSDFFDPKIDYADLPHDDFGEPEISFIRRVEHPRGEDAEDLKAALRSYLLAGAVKLYRLHKDPSRYPAEYFRHHTMLIHTSSFKGQQALLAQEAKTLWDQSAFNSPRGIQELGALWDDDYSKVAAAQGDELVPGAFTALKPYLSAALEKITADANFIRVVNSEKDEAPDFSAGPVWKIVIGGNKFSRGYTVEGLTVSYYRRQANTGDTLMQMGRWFGFRPGYHDLVRVFLGVKEGKREETDLVALFKEVCLMEERFREEIKRYLKRPGAPRVTPKQIPPLISIAGNLLPTARNKMIHAIVASKNFSETWSMPTLMAAKPAGMEENIRSLEHLLARQPGEKATMGGKASDGSSIKAYCVTFQVTNAKLVEFLTSYRWLEVNSHSERPADMELQIEFLTKEKHGISSWLIVAPQRANSFGEPVAFKGIIPLAVKNRNRVEEGRGFQVFGESMHRAIAEYLTGIRKDADKYRLTAPNQVTEELKSRSRGVMLLYPVREKENQKLVTVGFELLFPKNDLSFDLHFTVRQKAKQSSIVVADG
jgi:hypothetical protein